MGLLDDLKQQAGKQQDTSGPADEAQPAGVSNFYAEQAKERMLTAFNFLSELVDTINNVQLDTRADYPFRPHGKPVTLLQQDYKVYNDSITDPRQITFTFFCSLANPTVFDVTGRGAVMEQTELLDRYHFKYEKLEQKDPRQMVLGANFKLLGPLPVKMVLQVDEGRQVIKLLLANFAGAGTSQYHLKPEQMDNAFLDHLGKYLLRKETTLFKEEISDDVKAMLRKKLQEEQHQRETELQEAEEVRKAEEALRKQNSTTGQLKKAVGQSVTENTEKLKKAMNEQLKRVMQTQVAKGKESLKGLFDKLKKQPQAPQQTPPAQPTPQIRPVQSRPQTTPPASIPLTKPAVPEPKLEQVKVPTAPAAVQTATVKETEPQKVDNASTNNPFLKTILPVATPVDAAEREAKTAAEQTPASNPTTNPFLQALSKKVTAQTTVPPVANERPGTNLKSAELNTGLSEVTPITKQADSAKDAPAPEAKDLSQNPFLKPILKAKAPDSDIAGNVVPPQINDAKENP